jgi:hypothetical protein
MTNWHSWQETASISRKYIKSWTGPLTHADATTGQALLTANHGQIIYFTELIRKRKSPEKKSNTRKKDSI